MAGGGRALRVVDPREEPLDLAAEAALVSGILGAVEEAVAERLCSALPEAAVAGPLAPVWRGIRRLVLRGERPTLAAVAREIDWPMSRLLEADEEALRVAAPVEEVAVEHLLDMLMRRHLLRELERVRRTVVEQGPGPGLAALAEVQEAAKGFAAEEGLPPLLSAEAIAVAADLERPPGERPKGISTGLPTLDRITGGLEPGDLWLLGGRPGTGKTSLALQIALRQEAGVLFVSLDVPRRKLARKVLASAAGVELHRLRSATNWLADPLTDEERQGIEQGIARLGGRTVWVDDRSRAVEAIAWQVRRLRRYGLKLLVIDYLTLLDVPQVERWETRAQAVGALSKALKRLALDHGIAVLALSQLSRVAAGERPQLHHFRDSGALEEDADVALFLWDPDPDLELPSGHPRNRDLIAAKARDGPTGTVPCLWLPKRQEIQELEGEQPAPEKTQAKRAPKRRRDD
jgi:replicative DNA helicase